MAERKQYPLSIVLSAVDKATGPITRVTKTLQRVNAPLELVKARLNAFDKAAGVSRVLGGLKAVGSSIWDIGRASLSTALRLGGLAVAGTAAGFALLQSWARAGDSIGKTSTRLGIGVEALQEYRHAAELSGVSSQTFDMAMQRAGRRVAEAAGGIGEARVALRALRIETRDANGQVRTLEDLLPEFAEKLSNVKSESLRNALAMRLFDSEGVALVQMLQGGAKGLEKLREEARKTGGILSADEVKAAEDYTDAMTNLTASLKGIRNRIGAVVGPALTEFFKKMKDRIVELLPRVQEFAERFMEKLPERLRMLREKLDDLWESMRPVIDKVRELGKKFGWAKVLAWGLALGLGVFALALGAPLLIALGLATKAVAALGIALLTTPFGWVALGLGALALAGYLLWANWKKIAGWLEDLWDRLTDKLENLRRRTVGFLAGVLDKVGLGELRQVVDIVNFVRGPVGSSSAASAEREIAGKRSEAHVTIDINGAPAGSSARIDRGSSAAVELNLGYAIPGF